MLYEPPIFGDIYVYLLYVFVVLLLPNLGHMYYIQYVYVCYITNKNGIKKKKKNKSCLVQAKW